MPRGCGVTESTPKVSITNEWAESVRVVILLDDTDEGVIPVHVSRLATRLNRMDVRLVVCCLSGHGDHSEKIQGTDTAVVALDGNNTGGCWDGISGIMRVREVLARFKPDVLHALGAQSRWVAPLAALGSETRVVVRSQDETTRRGWGRRLIRLWSQVAGRVSCRLIPREVVVGRGRRFLRRSTVDRVVPEAVDSGAVRGRVAMELPMVDEESWLVGAFVGEGAVQDAWNALDAFRIFSARNERSDLILWGLGANDVAKRRVDELNLSGRVHFLGNPHEPAELIRALNVVWSLGHCERSNITVLTSMALGIPVVCTHETDLAKGIREVGGALMRDPLWPRQFAKATRDLLSQPELLLALQAAGPKLVDQTYRFQNHALQIRQIYEQLSSGSMGSESGTGMGFKSASTLT